MPLITVEDIAHVRYQAADLDLMERFLLDFGLTRAQRTETALHMRGSGTSSTLHVTDRGPGLGGTGFGLRARSADDLSRLAAHLGTAVENADGPDGGQVVRCTDPAGFRIEVLHGQRDMPLGGDVSAAPRNTADRRDRLGRALRGSARPSRVMRLGHVTLLVPDFAASLAFYTELLGLRITDSYHAGDGGAPIFAFLHCGLGERYTDHHTLAIGTPPGGIAAGRLDHAGFEVLDLDDLMFGNARLQAGGWRHSWGVGRHVEGSQIFDYWRDPFGNKVEHWTDGDLVNDHHVPSHLPLRPDGLAQWAPPLSPEFFA